MKNAAILFVLLVVGCTGSVGDDSPVAGLKVPGCILAGTTVQLDASDSSDPNGDIVKYIFTIGHSQAPIISEKPILVYTFEQPIFEDGLLYAYQILVTVVDVHGNAGHAEAEVAVVFNKSECPGNAPPVDISIPDEDIVQQPDDVVIPEEIVEPTEVVEPADVPEPEEVTDPEEITFPEVQPDTAPAYCPNVSGTYHLEVYCYGSIAADLELPLQQTVCHIEDPYGLFNGTVYENGTMEVGSTQPDLKMDDCEGQFEEGPDGFSLDCSSGCTAVFTPM